MTLPAGVTSFSSPSLDGFTGTIKPSVAMPRIRNTTINAIVIPMMTNAYLANVPSSPVMLDDCFAAYAPNPDETNVSRLMNPPFFGIYSNARKISLKAATTLRVKS